MPLKAARQTLEKCQLSRERCPTVPLLSVVVCLFSHYSFSTSCFDGFNFRNNPISLSFFSFTFFFKCLAHSLYLFTATANDTFHSQTLPSSSSSSSSGLTHNMLHYSIPSTPFSVIVTVPRYHAISPSLVIVARSWPLQHAHICHATMPRSHRLWSSPALRNASSLSFLSSSLFPQMISTFHVSLHSLPLASTH